VFTDNLLMLLLSMNTLNSLSIVKFHSSTPIEFDSDESPFQPNTSRHYFFAIEKTDDPNMVVLLDENPDSPTGVDRSAPISRSRFDILGKQEVIRKTTYQAGFAAPMSQFCKRWLEAEITSHENMTAEEATRFTCNLDAAHGNLKQTDDLMFAEIMEISDEDSVSDVRQEVEDEIERLTIELGGASLLREIIVWN
jgi:hypothetical protein